jgi:hypothetical protein
VELKEGGCNSSVVYTHGQWLDKVYSMTMCSTLFLQDLDVCWIILVAKFPANFPGLRLFDEQQALAALPDICGINLKCNGNACEGIVQETGKEERFSGYVL